MTDKEEKLFTGNFDLKMLAKEAHPEKLLKRMKPFQELMNNYRCALMEIETKFKVLDAEFSMEHERNPFETIKTRIKSPAGIIEKLRRKGCEITCEDIEREINDVAGVRVICAFPEDIYILADMLAKQDDITVLKMKDYISNPKPNGYRSLHLIVSIPIFLSGGKKHVKAEVQFRTIAMDFWASVEHKLKYKKDIGDAENIAKELKECAEAINNLDYKMQEIRNRIDSQP